MQVISDVAAIVNSGKPGADVEIHVREEAVLRIVRANSDSSGISILNFDINVTHRGVESSRTGVWWSFFRAGFRFPPRASRARQAAGEENHVRWPLLKARCVAAQDEDRAGLAVTDGADSRPYVNGFRDAVAAGRQEKDPLVGRLLDLVDGLLQDVRIICNAISVDGKRVECQLDG